MTYKILEVKILYNHPHRDYVISVAIESAPGYWKAYFKQINIISEKSIIEVATTGEKISKNRALEVFESCRVLELQKRLIFEE